MEKVIIQASKQLIEKLKKPDGYKKELEQELDDIIASGPTKTWPFRGVTKEDLISAVIPMVDVASSIEKEAWKIKGVTPEVLQDRIAYKTIDLLKCVNQMEYETKRFEANQNTERPEYGRSRMHNGPTHITPTYHDEAGRDILFAGTANAHRVETDDPFSKRTRPRPDNRGRAYMAESRQMAQMMQAISTWARKNMYEFNRVANQEIKEHFPRADIQLINVSDVGNYTYMPALAVKHTENVTRSHEEAYAAILDKFEQMLKYGLPNETSLGQMLDKIIGNRDEYKQENEELIKNLISREMDLEVIEHFFVPEMMLNAAIAEGQMQIERRLGNVLGYQQLHSTYTEQIHGANQCKKMIKDTRDMEAKMMPNLELSITKGKDGTYVVTVSKGVGEKREVEFKNETDSYKKVEQKNRRENTRVMTLGKVSQALREEKKTYSMIVKGTSAEFTEKVQDAKKRDTKISYQHDMSIGEAELSHTRTTRHSGKRSNRTNLQMDIGKMEGRIIKSHREGLNRKEDWNIGASAQGIGASASMSTPTIDSLGTPKLSAEAHLAKGSVNFKQLEASFNIGAKASIGMQITPEEISKKAAMILVGEALKGNSANLTRIADEVMDLIKSAGPSSSIDFTKINISAASLDLLNAELVREQNQEIGEVNYNSEIGSPIASDIKEDIENAPTYYDQVQDMVQFWGDITIEREQDQQFTTNMPMYSQYMGYVANQEDKNPELVDDEQEYDHGR